MNIKQILESDSKIGQILRFGLVGGLATLIQYGIYVLFVDAVNLYAIPSTIISYIISFIANFFLSNYFTFHTKPNVKKGIGFAVSHLINMGMQVGLVAVFKNIVGDTLALLPAFAICIPVNFLLVRFALTNKHFQSEK